MVASSNSADGRRTQRQRMGRGDLSMSRSLARWGMGPPMTSPLSRQRCTTSPLSGRPVRWAEAWCTSHLDGMQCHGRWCSRGCTGLNCLALALHHRSVSTRVRLWSRSHRTCLWSSLISAPCARSLGSPWGTTVRVATLAATDGCRRDQPCPRSASTALCNSTGLVRGAVVEHQTPRRSSISRRCRQRGSLSMWSDHSRWVLPASALHAACWCRDTLGACVCNPALIRVGAMVCCRSSSQSVGSTERGSRFDSVTMPTLLLFWTPNLATCSAPLRSSRADYQQAIVSIWCEPWLCCRASPPLVVVPVLNACAVHRSTATPKAATLPPHLACQMRPVHVELVGVLTNVAVGS